MLAYLAIFKYKDLHFGFKSWDGDFENLKKGITSLQFFSC